MVVGEIFPPFSSCFNETGYWIFFFFSFLSSSWYTLLAPQENAALTDEGDGDGEADASCEDCEVTDECAMLLNPTVGITPNTLRKVLKTPSHKYGTAKQNAFFFVFLRFKKKRRIEHVNTVRLKDRCPLTSITFGTRFSRNGDTVDFFVALCPLHAEKKKSDAFIRLLIILYRLSCSYTCLYIWKWIAFSWEMRNRIESWNNWSKFAPRQRRYLRTWWDRTRKVRTRRRRRKMRRHWRKTKRTAHVAGRRRSIRAASTRIRREYANFRPINYARCATARWNLRVFTAGRTAEKEAKISAADATTVVVESERHLSDRYRNADSFAAAPIFTARRHVAGRKM